MIVFCKRGTLSVFSIRGEVVFHPIYICIYIYILLKKSYFCVMLDECISDGKLDRRAIFRIEEKRE